MAAQERVNSSVAYGDFCGSYFFPDKFGRNMGARFGDLRARRHCGVELTVARSR